MLMLVFVRISCWYNSHSGKNVAVVLADVVYICGLKLKMFGVSNASGRELCRN